MAGGLGLGALVALTGMAGYQLAKDDPAAPPATTTTTTALSTAAVAEAVAARLGAGLPIGLRPEQATCVAAGVLAVVPPAELADLAGTADPVVALDPARRAALLREVVGCLDPAQAEALLATTPTTAVVTDLPGAVEG